jgi:hypothetical protein
VHEFSFRLSIRRYIKLSYPVRTPEHITYDKRDKSFGEVPPLACIIMYFLTAHRKSRQHPNKAAIEIGLSALTRRICKPEELTSPPQGLQDSKSDGAIQVSFRHCPSTMQLASVSRDERSRRTLFGPSSIVPLGVAIVSPINIVERNIESCITKACSKARSWVVELCDYRLLQISESRGGSSDAVYICVPEPRL